MTNYNPSQVTAALARNIRRRGAAPDRAIRYKVKAAFAATALDLSPPIDRVRHQLRGWAASVSAGRRSAMIYRILKRVPGGHNVQVFVGVCLVLGIGARRDAISRASPPRERTPVPRAAAGMAPVAYKKTKRGHDYFSSEKRGDPARQTRVVSRRERVARRTSAGPRRSSPCWPPRRRCVAPRARAPCPGRVRHPRRARAGQVREDRRKGHEVTRRPPSAARPPFKKKTSRS